MGFTVYHVSNDVEKIIEEFIPRIPRREVRADKFEDSSTPRVCVSANIPGCITGKPKIGNEEVLDAIYRVYEFDVDFVTSDNSLVGYYELYERGLVNDALATKEYWITKPIKPIRTYIINVKKISMELVPVCPVEYIQDYLDILRDDPDNSDNWLDIHGGYLISAYDKIKYKNLDDGIEHVQCNIINNFWNYRRELGRLIK